MKQLPILPESVTTLIPTVEEAAKTIDALGEILQAKFKIHTNPYEEMKRLLPYPTMSSLMSLYQEAEGSMTSPAELCNFLDMVRHILQTLPTLSIQLAVTPTKQILEHISAWVTENLHEPHLLQISVKNDLIAGATIGYQGRMKDYSLVKKLPELFKN